jgi:Ca-activated chloride channel family protein
VNLAFVLDRSGSMSGGKLDLARRAVEASIARLDPNDRFAVVVYDDQVDVVAEGAAATQTARASAIERLHGIVPRGSTNLGEGWLRGCEQVSTELLEQGVNRVLLLTDGLANVGMTDPDELAGHAAALRARGVSTTTFGVGADFDEQLVAGMADAGGGHFYFIRDAGAIEEAIAGEVGEALEVVARDAAIEVAGPDGLRIDTLLPPPGFRLGARTQIPLGDLVSEQVVRVVLRAEFPLGGVGEEIGAVVSLRDRDGVLAAGVDAAHAAHAAHKVGWTYADNPANDRQPRDVEVDRAVAEVYAARARTEAVALNKQGRFAEAGSALTGVARRIETYAGRDPAMRELARSLRAEVDEFTAPMAPLRLKDRMFVARNMSLSRMPDGRATRRPSA